MTHSKTTTAKMTTPSAASHPYIQCPYCTPDSITDCNNSSSISISSTNTSKAITATYHSKAASFSTVDELYHHITLKHPSLIHTSTSSSSVSYVSLYPHWIQCILCEQILPTVEELELHSATLHPLVKRI
jgi:hypothetical protein